MGESVVFVVGYAGVQGIEYEYIIYEKPKKLDTSKKEDKKQGIGFLGVEFLGLEKQGIEDGDTVSVYDIEFDYVS